MMAHVAGLNARAFLVSIFRACRSFNHGSVEIAYLDEGQGEPIVLVHGFASSKEVNWVQPGWFATLTGAGRRVIALDNRGHGAVDQALRSGRLSHRRRWPATCVALLDHLGIERADVMGYSMGARITAFLALAHPERVRSIVLGGLGMHLVDGVGLAREHRRGAGGAVARRRDRSAGPHVPRLRRSDQVRPPGARRLHPRLAAGADPRAGGVDPDADADRGRHQGPDRRLRRRACRDACRTRQALPIPGPRPHARGRRQGVQGGRAGIPRRSSA